VDPGDTDLAEKWFGDGGQAFRVGAVRELFEEAGIAVTRSGIRAATAFDEIEQDPPTVEMLPEVAHWVAPEDVPVRFDARYVAAASPLGVTPSPDGTETSVAWWSTPADLMSQWQSEERKLYWPTYFTLGALTSCTDVGDLLALRLDTREPDDHELEYLHRSTFYDD
jgi:8-oxo-dGTP pyrophosphatase MutT (NUDIX family)